MAKICNRISFTSGLAILTLVSSWLFWRGFPRGLIATLGTLFEFFLFSSHRHSGTESRNNTSHPASVESTKYCSSVIH